jgi:hypothetical protein
MRELPGEIMDGQQNGAASGAPKFESIARKLFTTLIPGGSHTY